MLFSCHWRQSKKMLLLCWLRQPQLDACTDLLRLLITWMLGYNTCECNQLLPILLNNTMQLNLKVRQTGSTNSSVSKSLAAMSTSRYLPISKVLYS
jgi:hypothetical protein